MTFNVPPGNGICVPAEAMRVFVTALFEKCGTSRDDAEFLARLLVQTDLWGVFSHGTQKVPGYVQMILDGRVNPRPKLQMMSSTSTTLVVDGDGGLGHFPCYRGTEWAIAKAREHGLAAVTTRNHFHFGPAAYYTRMALEYDCIGLAISSHRYRLDPEESILRAGGGSPISVAIPAGKQPPLVLDMGTTFPPWDVRLFNRYPWVYFRNLGLGAIFQALGGILAGVYRPELQPPQSRWESDQGAFIAVFDLKSFLPVDEFKKEMDRYIGQARKMKPLPGYNSAEFCGGPERRSEREYARNGIPVSPEHRKSLEQIATKLEVQTPFAKHEHTRFNSQTNRSLSMWISQNAKRFGRRAI
jgi:LDH2 family malate/lactate/ureidoglycolate dehydrogenase